MVLTTLASALLALAGPPAQSGVVADPSTPASTLQISPPGWVTGPGPGFAAEPAAVSLRESPKDDLTAVLAVGTDQSLSLSLFDGSAWGSPSVLAADVGIDDSTTSDAAFEASSGRLLIAYRKGSSSLIFFRVYDAAVSPALGAEDWFDLGLPGAPSRLILRPRAGTNQATLVAASGTTIRAAVWDGTGFADTATLDSSFDNHPGAIDAEWSGSTAQVVWARSTDTTPRGSVFDGNAWASAVGLPTLADPIQRVRLAPSNDRGTRALLMTLATSDGASTGLHAAVFAESAWTAASVLSSSLADADRFAASWETSGGGAVAVWPESGETTLHAARWDGSAWSVATQTGDLGGAVEGLVARPAASDTDGVHALASVSVEGATLTDYLVYASSGSLSLGGTAVNGLAGSNEGFTLPDPPTASATGSNVSIGNNQAVTKSPGVYGTLSTGNNSTLNLSAGDYVFSQMTSNKNGFTINADTTGGPVRLIFTAGDFTCRNNLTFGVTGPGPFEVHLLAGDFSADQNATLTASIITHGGDITLGNNADLDAHLVASGNVDLSGNTLDPPGWDSPFVDPSPPSAATTTLVGFTVSAGSVGSPTTVVSGWSESHALPFDMSWARPTAGLRFSSWREVPSYNDGP